MSASYDTSKNAIGALRGMRARPRELCELCNLPLAKEHPHLLQVSNYEVLCACEACALLFCHRGEQRRFLRIPRGSQRLGELAITDAQWRALRLPIDLAFFVQRSSDGRPAAFYPSPAGCTESLLDGDAWAELVQRNAALTALEQDVEALLVNRTQERRDYFIAPIDQCYRLAGLIRRHWRGFSGGDQVWKAIGSFFEELDARSNSRKEPVRA